MVRFALDIGVASVGWAVVDENYKVLEAGSNLFNCADASKNVERRNFRQMKRLHRRRQNRVSDFVKLWSGSGMEIPENISNNVLNLRVKGLSEGLSQEDIFAVLRNELLHRGISYLDDAIDETSAKQSSYQSAIALNQAELEKNEYPCMIQMERLREFGKYHGEQIYRKNDEILSLSNVFTKSAYEKEIKTIFATQEKFHAFLTEEFQEKYLKIFNRKRKYYEGPGSKLSRTDYGKYTLKIDPETGDYITEKNIFEKLIGKCSIYPDEMRAAGASYTAQEFNLLNDLNTLNVNGEKLTKDQKIQIIEKVKTENRVNVKKIIEQVIGEEIDTMTGVRHDKDDKEDFHKFEQYRKMKSALEKRGLDIQTLTREQLDIIGEILTLNTEKEAIFDAFIEKKVQLSDEMQECFYELRKKNTALFSKWQSFSLKIMEELIPDLYSMPKNQMQLLTEKGLIKSKKDLYKDAKYLPENSIIEDIYNPVVVRSIRIAIRIMNALLKKYGNPKQVIVEMPRDKNSEEEKKRLTDIRNKNEKELNEIIKSIADEYGIRIKEEDFYHHKNLVLKLKLWKEQNGICLYSGKTISIQELLKDQSKFEIDHIIPRSISFDDSRTNKVLVYHSENQLKGNQTPYYYLKQQNREWDFEKYKAFVYELKNKKDKYKIPRKKVENLLFMEDITKQEVLQGFIKRNINDTRYASRIILNALQDYFKAQEADTTVRVIRGSFTHQMRKALRLTKDRDESFVHHAIDAMLMCYSQMAQELFYKKQKKLIDPETGEIVDPEEWDKLMDDEKYAEIVYTEKCLQLREEIKKAEEKIKYWHKRDTKPNRGLCNQTIRGTRVIKDKVMKINKFNLYDPKDVNKVRNMIATGKENKFLMYQKDKKTWENLCLLLEEYRDSKNPFIDYEKETGDVFRKYAKKHNGPKVSVLKYEDGEVGSCIDISHKYGFEKDSRKVILESLKPYRTDVYYCPKTGKYYFVGLKYSDLKFEHGKYVIDEKAYHKALVNERVLNEDESPADLEGKGIEFRLSFYENDIIEYEKNGEIFIERFLSRTKPKNINYIETKPVKSAKWENKLQNQVGLSKTTSVRKIRTDILGNCFPCIKEKFQAEVDF